MSLPKLPLVLAYLGLFSLVATAATFNESGGTVSIEAENFDSTDVVSGKSWQQVADTTASSTTAMVVGPDSGITASTASGGPVMNFKLKINTA